MTTTKPDILSIPQNYALFRVACPHYDELQNAVGREVCESLMTDYINIDAVLNSFNNSTRHPKIKPLNIVDIGCGLGDTSLAVLNAFPACVPFLSLNLVDTNMDALEKSKEVLERFSCKKILCNENVISFWQYQDPEEHSCVYSAWTLHNFEKEYRSNVFKKIETLLYRNRTLVLADKILPDNPEELRKAYFQQEEWFEELAKIGRPDLKNAWKQHYLEDLHPSKVWYEKEAVKDLKDAGFKGVKVHQRWGLECLITGVKK